MTVAVKTTDLTVAYDRKVAVQSISGSFAAGSLTAVIGPNGAGKSTLIKTLVGVLHPALGQVEVHGPQTSVIGYLPQGAEIDRHFPLSVGDTVAMGAWQRTGALRGLSRALAQRAVECLAAVGLAGIERQSIAALSSGQLQRVLFARLLLQDAPLIVLDEPFNAMDARTTADLLRLVCDWHRQGRTLIAVLHDLDQVRAHFPNTLLMARRAVAWGATDQVLTPENLQQARALAQVCPSLEHAAS